MELVAIVGAVALALDNPTALMLIARIPVSTARASLLLPNSFFDERN